MTIKLTFPPNLWLKIHILVPYTHDVESAEPIMPPFKQGATPTMLPVFVLNQCFQTQQGIGD